MAAIGGSTGDSSAVINPARAPEMEGAKVWNDAERAVHLAAQWTRTVIVGTMS